MRNEKANLTPQSNAKTNPTNDGTPQPLNHRSSLYDEGVVGANEDEDPALIKLVVATIESFDQAMNTLTQQTITKLDLARVEIDLLRGALGTMGEDRSSDRRTVSNLAKRVDLLESMQGTPTQTKHEWRTCAATKTMSRYHEMNNADLKKAFCSAFRTHDKERCHYIDSILRAREAILKVYPDWTEVEDSPFFATRRYIESPQDRIHTYSSWPEKRAEESDALPAMLSFKGDAQLKRRRTNAKIAKTPCHNARKKVSNVTNHHQDIAQVTDDDLFDVYMPFDVDSSDEFNDNSFI